VAVAEITTIPRWPRLRSDWLDLEADRGHLIALLETPSSRSAQLEARGLR
jgi:hypothetical protein